MTEKPIVLVFCERIDNESFCESIIRELEAYYEVRPCGPNWPKKDLDEIASNTHPAKQAAATSKAMQSTAVSAGHAGQNKTRRP